VSYPFKDEKWFLKVLLGGFSFIIPIFTFAYFFCFLKNTYSGKKMLPEWSQIKENFFEGIVFTVIGFIFLIIPWCIYRIANNIGSSFLSKQFSLFTISLKFLAMIIFLLAIYFLPLTFIRYVKTNNVKRTFALKELFAELEKNFFDHTLAYLYSVFLGISGGIILGLLGVIWFGFLLVFPFIYFYLALVTLDLFSHIYLEK
jgi:F0F1-type ATP synthase assembly protein I